MRRASAAGQCIPWHCDNVAVHKVSVQIALNDDSEYEGGRVVFLSKLGALIPKRAAGTATVHDSTVVHGVTRMGEGVRYSLFLLDPEASGMSDHAVYDFGI